MTRLARILATWFGCGYFPWGPGTAGSLAAIAIAWLLRRTMFQSPVLLVLTIAPAIWSAGATAKAIGREDPRIVVIDEVIGQWIALLPCYFHGTALHRVSWIYLVAAFVLFRIFDIVKPWPANALERLPGGWGIVADDVMAGIYAALVLYFAGWFNFISVFFYGLS